jgi:class 3 adenylate cyclase/tetratricopeptide (TPR) repeat protein
MNVADWLRVLGLERYEATFRQNDVDTELLPKLTADDLKELGITSLGHRRRLLEAIAVLRLKDTPTDDPTQSAISPTESLSSETIAERRPLCVMFCDLVGSTALSSRLDPEDLREVIRNYQACVVNTIRHFDGFIARYVGDGVLIYFGWPEARETDAERAVRAGLSVAVAVNEASLGGEPLHVCIGIATGLVVIGEPIGFGDSRQQTAVGETPNLAARLQGLAAPGQVVIDAATRRQIGGLFECQDLGTVELKGLPAVSAWQVLSENRTLGQFEALGSGGTPLVGRNEETELLLRRWAQAKAGSGRVVLISAEPGVGKSRLVEALAERIATEPHVRLRYFCSPHHQDSALFPVVTQMERAAGFARGDTPVARLNKLQMLLAPAALPKEDEALIAELHSLPSADHAPPLDVTPQRRKQRMFEALLRQAERLSREQPVLMEFEDVHWIDFSSREYLDRAVEWIVNWPVLVLVTFRPEFQPPWTGQPHVTTLALARLDRGDAETLVGNIAGNHELPPETVQEIAERTDGVPLFIEELTKAVLEAGPQEITSQRSKLRPAKSIPATLHASLIARLDRLGPAARRIAQIGAALGRVFSYDVLLAVAAPPQSEQRLREALERLVAAQLVSQIGAPPDALYSFKHALVQDAAYTNLLREKRQELHGHIAGILEKAFPETAETQPDLIAHHCALGGLARRAVHWWRAAGRQAIRRAANVEAVAHLKRALELIGFEAAGRERDLLELEVRVELGGPLIGTKGWGAPELAENYTRAWALCETIDMTPHVFPVLWGLFTTAVYRVESGLVEAKEIAERFLNLAQQRGEIGLEVIGHRILGVILVSVGQLVPGRGHLERAVALYGHECPELEDTYGIQPRISALANLCLALQYLGYLDQASQIADQAMEEAKRLGQFNTLGVALHLTGRLRAFRRESHLVRESGIRADRAVPTTRFDRLGACGRDIAGLGGGLEGRLAADASGS